MTIDHSTIRKCAKNMVRTCNVKPGEGVIVKGGAHNQELLEEIALECYRHDSTPTIVISSDRYVQKVYREIPERTLSRPPKQFVGMVKESDLLISVEELDDPSIAHHFPRTKLKARQKAGLPILDLVYHKTKGKKWLYAGWPTKAAARSFGIPYRDLEDIIIGGLTVPTQSLRKIGARLKRRFGDASWVHVWDRLGTDFRVKVEGRRLNIDDGFISDDDFDAFDRGANLPAGEVFYAPHESVGDGTIFCPITRDRVSDRLVKDVRLEFRKGKLLLDSVRAEKNLDALLASFVECEEVDRTRFKKIRTTNMAELGIGYNPHISKAIGYILTDEKVKGTVHVAFGANNTYGGTSESTMHWDFVTAPGINIEAERKDGQVVPIMKNGRFV